MRRPTFKIILFAVGLACAITLAMTKDVEIVPAWSVLVVDTAGKPVPGLDVEEDWRFFGLRSDGSDLEVTDSAGRVTFPRQSFKITRTSFLLSWGLSHLNVHASFGPSGSVRIHPDGSKTMSANYDTDRKVYDDAGAHTARTGTGFDTTLRVLARDLFDFVEAREWEEAKQAILRNPSVVTMRDRNGYTALVQVAMEGFTGGAAEVLRLLVENGADINAQANDGMTALHQAAKNHDLAAMEYLLAHKADPNRRIHGSTFEVTNGFTPLHFQLGAYDIFMKSVFVADRIKGIGILLDHGADINARDATGKTPLHLAAEWGDPDIVAALLAHNADARAVNANGKTPLALIQSLDDTPAVRKVRALLSAAQSGQLK